MSDTVTRDLLLRIQQGDVSAMGTLYDRQSTAVYSLAYRIVRNQADAEEVVQDTFLQVWRHAGTFDDRRGSVHGWVLTIARSRAIDRLRRTYGRMRWEQGFGAHGDEPMTAPDGGDWALIREEHDRGVREHCDALPAAQRIALELAFYQGLTHTDIAAILRQPLGTIKTRIRLALHRIRDGLNGQAVETPVREASPFAGALAEYLAKYPQLPHTYAGLEGVRILLVDDDAETVEMTATVLQTAGANVMTARSTMEALSRLDDAWPDVLLADIAMPHADGYALLHKVRALADASGRPLTAVAFTALGRPAHQNALGAGFAAVVAKPVRPHRLLEVVARLAGRLA